jgi:hypothetical protein
MNIRPLTRPARGFIALLACGLWFTSAQGAAPQRFGYDPLSADEMARAEAVLRQDNGAAALLKGRVEWLFTERLDEPKGTAIGPGGLRRAEVNVYLYDHDRLLRAVVDLRSGKLVGTELLAGEQLPPTRAESARSLDIALADRATAAAIRQEFQRVSGKPLTAPDQLVARALVFRADADPDAGKGEAAQCGAHRCMQMLLTTRDSMLVNVLPIVDLSRRSVVGAVPFVGAAP